MRKADPTEKFPYICEITLNDREVVELGHKDPLVVDSWITFLTRAVNKRWTEQMNKSMSRSRSLSNAAMPNNGPGNLVKSKSFDALPAMPPKQSTGLVRSESAMVLAGSAVNSIDSLSGANPSSRNGSSSNLGSQQQLAQQQQYNMMYAQQLQQQQLQQLQQIQQYQQQQQQQAYIQQQLQLQQQQQQQQLQLAQQMQQMQLQSQLIKAQSQSKSQELARQQAQQLPPQQQPAPQQQLQQQSAKGKSKSQDLPPQQSVQQRNGAIVGLDDARLQLYSPSQSPNKQQEQQSPQQQQRQQQSPLRDDTPPQQPPPQAPKVNGAVPAKGEVINFDSQPRAIVKSTSQPQLQQPSPQQKDDSQSPQIIAGMMNMLGDLIKEAEYESLDSPEASEEDLGNRKTIVVKTRVPFGKKPAPSAAKGDRPTRLREDIVASVVFDKQSNAVSKESLATILDSIKRIKAKTDRLSPEMYLAWDCMTKGKSPTLNKREVFDKLSDLVSECTQLTRLVLGVTISEKRISMVNNSKHASLQLKAKSVFELGMAARDVGNTATSFYRLPFDSPPKMVQQTLVEVMNGLDSLATKLSVLFSLFST